MNKRLKLLERMRANPRGDWTIQNMQTVAREFGITIRPPKRGDHYTASHPDLEEILTIPARRPIKPVYVKRFVSMIDSIT